jgi:hypothetical protein
VTSLAPGERRTVEWSGPACTAGQAVRAWVDPEDLIDEADDRDNVRERRCEALPAA